VEVVAHQTNAVFDGVEVGPRSVLAISPVADVRAHAGATLLI